MADMQKIKDYAFAAVVSQIVAVGGNLNQGFLDLEQTLAQIRGLIPHQLPEEVWLAVFEHLKALDVYQTLSDDVAGDYHKLIHAPAVIMAKEANKNPASLIYKYRAIGPEFLTKALRNLEIDERAGVDKMPLSDVQIPASDRTVSLNHNEISEFDERTSEIIDSVEKFNQIDEIPGFRELIVGQLKAGRELIQAGSFKLYVLQVTLIDSLMFLAKRYEKETIGALASALLTALLAHFGIAP